MQALASHWLAFSFTARSKGCLARRRSQLHEGQLSNRPYRSAVMLHPIDMCKLVAQDMHVREDECVSHVE